MGIRDRLRASKAIKKGIECFNKGKYEEAENLFSESISLNKDSPEAYFSRAQARRALLKLEQAIEDCSEAIKLESGNPTIWELRGMTRLQRREHALAVDDFKMVIRLNPGNIQIRDNLARSLIYLNRCREAIVVCTHTLETFPPNMNELKAIFHSIRGEAYLKWGKNKQALEDYKVAITLSDDEFPRIYIERALVHEA